MNQNGRIVELACSQIGKPYRHMCAGPDWFDCFGLLVWIARKLGHDVPPIDPYSRNPSGRRMVQGFRKHAKPVRISEVQPGNFLHMAFGKEPQHVAIVVEVDPIKIVHATSQYGRVEKRGLDTQWKDAVRGAYAFPEIN